MANTKAYNPLTPRLAWLLAAPHTWPASILPVLLAVAFAAAEGREIPVVAAFALLVISVLLQSAVNTLNDYFDYVKGSDSAEDNVEVDDAVLVYGNVNPASARNLAIAFVVAALALGVYCVWYAGWVPLAVAGVGILVVFLYSGGKTPISYLPIGEVVSGTVMGALITFASYTVLTREVQWLVLVWSIPLVVGIGLIMMTNNTCDIEKDALAERKTLPVLVGRRRAVGIYHGSVLAWFASIAVIVAVWFTPGIVLAPFMALGAYPLARALWKNPLVSATRVGAMGQVCSLNIALGAFYTAMVLASSMAFSL